MLKQSQNLTNLAPFTDELISKHPEDNIKHTDTINNNYSVYSRIPILGGNKQI